MEPCLCFPAGGVPMARALPGAWVGMDADLPGAGTDSYAVRPLPAPTLGGLLSCSSMMLPICAGSLLPFQTALAPLGQLAFPERGHSSQVLLCPAWAPKQPAIRPGQRGVHQRARESTASLRGWDKGQESHAHSVAFSSGSWKEGQGFLFILQLWPRLEWQGGGQVPTPTQVSAGRSECWSHPVG